MQVAVETWIGAPREEVFAVLTDVEGWPGTISAIDRVEKLTPGPVRSGTRFRETRVMFGREASEEMTFAEIAPPGGFVLTAESHGTRYRAEHVLREENGGTRVRIVFAGTPVTLAARILTPLAYFMKGTVRRQLAADLEDVKRALEARRPPGST